MNDGRIWPGIVLRIHDGRDDPDPDPSQTIVPAQLALHATLCSVCSEHSRLWRNKRRNSNDVTDSIHGFVGETLHKVAFRRQGNHMSAVRDGSQGQIPHRPYTPQPEEL